MGGVKILEDLPITLEPEEVMERLHARDGEQIRALVAAAMPLIRAKALYRVAYVDERTPEGVVIEGTPFHSRVLSKNLEEVGRVFPHVITIGDPMEHEISRKGDLLEKYYLDGIANMALMQARGRLEDHLRTRFALEGVSYMSPGSLQDWPIEAQSPLFSLLGDVKAAVGVGLSDTLLMIPSKSVSGIYFPGSVSFVNCKLCPREHCGGRRAAYDASLAREYGIGEED
jgi:hypothetical protein